MRCKPPDFTRGPRKIRWLVDRREIAASLSALPDEARGCMAIFRESLREFVRERIEIVGIAVMKEIPDDVEVVARGRVDEGLHRGEIMLAGTVDERPSDGLAHGVNAGFGQARIVGVAMQI